MIKKKSHTHILRQIIRKLAEKEKRLSLLI